MSITYDIKEEAVFDRMVAMLKEVSEQEQKMFMSYIDGYKEGVREGQRIAEKKQDDAC